MVGYLFLISQQLRLQRLILLFGRTAPTSLEVEAELRRLQDVVREGIAAREGSAEDQAVEGPRTVGP